MYYFLFFSLCSFETSESKTGKFKFLCENIIVFLLFYSVGQYPWANVELGWVH